jgi:hypothetical protein
VELVSDRGTHFKEDFADLLQRWRIRHYQTASYSPAHNGQAERIVGVLRTALCRLIEGQPTEWDLQLPQAMYAYRLAAHSSTGISLAYTLMGKEFLVPQQLPHVADNQPQTYVENTTTATTSLRPYSRGARPSTRQHLRCYAPPRSLKTSRRSTSSVGVRPTPPR